MIIFNYRKRYILQTLLSEFSPITVSELAKQLDCSERTLRDDLDIVDDWLHNKQCPRLIRKPGVGIYINANKKTRHMIEKKLRTIPLDRYELNQEERLNLILLILLTAIESFTIKSFEELFLVSRGTIVKDLEEVDTFLRKYHLKLIRKRSKGLKIEGSEIDIRQALIYLCTNTDPLLVQMVQTAQNKYKSQTIKFSKSMQHVANLLNVDEIQGIIEPLLSVLDVKLSDDGRMALYLHIGMVIKRLGNKGSLELHEELEHIYTTPEYQIATVLADQIENHFNVNLPRHEIAYIALHLLGNQRAPVMPDKFDFFSGRNLQKLIRRMTLMMERLLQVKFKKKEELLKGLLLHIRPAIFRATYGLKVENPLTSDIKEEFNVIYESLKQVITIIENEYDIIFSDEELAYITMHYGGALSYVEEAKDSPLKIIIVCSSGLGTANLLKSKLKSSFSNVKILNTLSYQLYSEKDNWNADLIVSTIKVTNSSIPVIIVNPLLPKKDFEKLSLYAKPKKVNVFTPQQLYEKIWPIISKHSIIKNPSDLTSDLITAFEMLLNNQEILANNISYNLESVLFTQFIQLDVKVKDWRTAIHEATKPLERLGVIKESYKDEIINIINERGPYMAVAPGIMLAHGSINEHNQQVLLSLTRLKPPISFGHETNDPISLLFVFVTPNNFSHVPALQKLLEKLALDGKRHALEVAESPSEAIQVLIDVDR